MKKSLLALAVLGAFAGAASAQSSVTIFGIADLGLTYTKTGSVKAKTMDASGNLPSLFGFTGTEDLGGGLKANFHLEGQLSMDTGGFSINAGKFFDRRSTISLIGGFGELRLGRDFQADYLIEALFDPFTHVGPGNGSLGLQITGYAVSQPAAFNYLWSDNMVAYSLPGNLGGFYGTFQVAAGEGTASNKYTGGRVGYAAGPFDVTVGYSITDSTGADEFERTIIAGSYDFGAAKVSLVYSDKDFGTAVDQKTIQVGAWVPLGAGQLKFSYVKDELEGTAATAAGLAGDATKLEVGYVQFLSKRTAAYVTLSSTDRDVAADKTNAANVGIRHIF